MSKVIRTANYTLVDNSEDILKDLQKNIVKASTAFKEQAVGDVKNKMQNGYYRAIWQTGNLMRSVDGEVQATGNGAIITVGSGMDYGIYVHEGTQKMPARPYLKDGIMDNIDNLMDIFEAYLK